MNPNKALWEKGDFTRTWPPCAESGEKLVLIDRSNARDEGARSRMRGWDDRFARGQAFHAEVLGVDIARNLVEAGNRRAREQGLSNLRFEEGDASDLSGIEDARFDLVVSIFGAMFAPRPFDVAREMVRVTRPGGSIVMGNWIPNDPTLVAQILKISGAYSPPPPEGFVSPMTWGTEANVVERFAKAGVSESDVTCVRDTYIFAFPSEPAKLVDEFRLYYGPTMNAFAAAEQNGRAGDLHAELNALFESQNKSEKVGETRIPATFLNVTAVKRP